MTSLHESDVEQSVIKWLQEQGYSYLSPEDHESERENRSEVILRSRLKASINKLNPDIPKNLKEQALQEVLDLPCQNLVENNEAFHQMLTDGMDVEYQKNGDSVGGKICLIDFESPKRNDFVVCNQLTVTENNNTNRPDVILFVNGLPLVVIELKNPTDENTTTKKAFIQLQNYKKNISSLFYYNGVLVVSDGPDAKMGSLTAGWSRFMAWKTVDGKKEAKSTTPQIETLIKGMLRPDILLDLIKQFSVFEKIKERDAKTGLTTIETVKKIAAYHQYHAVNKAVQSTIRAAMKISTEIIDSPKKHDLPTTDRKLPGDRRGGVVWHTQGSGKSLSMVFYVGKLVINQQMGNPTILVITDRNDLDGQLFDIFAGNSQLLRQEPVQADSRKNLKELLKTAGGGIVFTTIQKFSPEDDAEKFEMLSERNNIVVIADEAHRSQYGFAAKTLVKNKQVFTRYGFAKNLRDALPNASFIGFTGTPIEKKDASTRAVFGHHIDVYDIQQAVEDGATVPIYYESRLAKVHLKAEEKEKLDIEVEQITENEEMSAADKAKWTQLEAIVGHKDRLKVIAKDIIDHFEKRRERA